MMKLETSLKSLILIFLCTGSLNLFSQKNFVPGYYVSTNGDTITGLILNKNWMVSPSVFMFKKSLGSGEKEISVNEARSFAIGVNEIYEARSFVYREVPEKTFSNEDEIKNFDSLKAAAFLRVIVRGEVCLLKYVSPTTLNHYVINVKGADYILQYDKYRIVKDTASYIAQLYEVEGKIYQKQLRKILFSQPVLFADIQKLEYNDKAMAQLVLKYNNLTKPGSVELFNLSDKIKIYIMPSFGIGFPTNRIESVVMPSIGFDFVVPRNFEKWVFFTNVSYKFMNAEATYKTIFGDDTLIDINVRSIVVSGGVRKYFTNKNLRPFLFTGGHLWFSDNNDARNYFVGAGISFKKKAELSIGYYDRLNFLDGQNRFNFLLLTFSWRFRVFSYVR